MMPRLRSSPDCERAGAGARFGSCLDATDHSHIAAWRVAGGVQRPIEFVAAGETVWRDDRSVGLRAPGPAARH